jgi:hypothetical protein
VLIEKHNEIITLNTHFRLVLQIINKTTSKRFLNLENLKLRIGYEKTSEKELDIIDIVEKEVEINDNANITLICKSEALGNLFLPRLTVTDENTKKSQVFDKLFNFTCVEQDKINLI